MKPKEFFTAFFGKTYNMPAEEVASLFANEEGTELAPNALDALLSKDVTRVKGFTDKNQEYFNNGQAKATKEIMSDFEKKVVEKFGIASDKKGLELIEEVVGLKTGDKTAIEENKVKAHPAYIALQDAMTKKVNEVEGAWKDKYTTFEKQVAKEKILSKVIETSMPYLDGYGLPEDTTLRNNQLKFFRNEIEALEWEPHENDYIIKDTKGEVVTDKHGNRMTHEKLVHNIAGNYWAKKEGQQRSGSGGDNNPGGKGNPGSAYTGKLPANDAELRTALAACKTGEERIALSDAYKAKSAGSN